STSEKRCSWSRTKNSAEQRFGYRTTKIESRFELKRRFLSARSLPNYNRPASSKKNFLSGQESIPRAPVLLATDGVAAHRSAPSARAEVSMPPAFPNRAGP